ncbi:MAG: adenylate/guanylate cyclase domain-containing protein [Syntrophorhabdaceae bacterium]|nr:adenylate/guanylate cyclase domain-containing protein [Syntrophorhabdaceae bacterium]
MTFTPAQKKIVSGVAVAAASVVLAFLLWAAGAFERWEMRTWDWRVGITARPSPSTDRIRLIMLDQQSLDWAQEENGLPWPWPREVYSVIISYLKRAGAQSISFDVLYTEPSFYGVSDDDVFGESIENAGNFIAATHFSEQSGNATLWPGGYPEVWLTIQGLDQWLSAGKERGVSVSRGLFPIPEIAVPSFALADVQHDPDTDGIYRRARLFRIFDEKAVASFGLAPLMASSPDLRMEIREGSLFVDGKEVPIDARGKAILRFRGPSGTAFRHYSAAAVIQSELREQAGEPPVIQDPEAFRGRHVIFGFSAPGLFDLRPTPVGGVFPGAEIHATTLDNLLEGDFVIAVAPAATFALAFFLALVCAFAVLFSKKAWQSLLLCAVFLPLPAIICLLACNEGYWLPLVVQEAGISFSLMGAFTVNYATEGRQKRFIKGAFRQYLSPAVIDQLIEHPERLKLGGEKRIVSIFFSDIQGFAGISEGLDPEALTALLNEYLSAMTDIIQEEGGTVDKYIGDAIIAFWNAPLDQQDHAERAARSALRCQEKLAEMRPGIRERIGIDLFMRIGLNTGAAVVGNMGSNSRFDYTILGDAVNLAARLEGINKQFGTYILASESLRSALPDSVHARNIAHVAVVGRKEPVHVFELLSQKDFESQEQEFSSFADGLRAFTGGDFQAALDIFLSTSKSDPSAESYARKCRALIEHPPQHWDGVWVMTDK